MFGRESSGRGGDGFASDIFGSVADIRRTAFAALDFIMFVGISIGGRFAICMIDARGDGILPSTTVNVLVTISPI